MKNSLFLLVLASGLAVAQAPSGYYNSANGLSGASLKTALSNIITNGHQDKGYNGLWTGYKTTDIDKNYENDGSILDIYSEKPSGTDPYKFTPVTNQCGTYSVEGNCYNREHLVPQSLFNESSPMVSDIHFIRATDGKVNGMRSNYPFGKVGTASFTSKNGSKLGTSASSGYSGTVFEPIDEFKGDVARMIFYFVTRYQSRLSTFSSGNMLGSSAYPGLQTWELNVLLAWHNQDPVSQAEINRNNASYSFQGNRNPFIDNPNYVSQIWGSGSTSGTGTTTPPSSTGCANETFETIPTASSASYLTRTWTNNGISWTATDARTDQTISSKAITVRDGSLASGSSANGIGSLTVTTQLKFTGSNGTFNVKVNGNTVGTVPYNSNTTTTTINNINISGNVAITLENNSTSDRVAIDNLSWTCYSGTSRQTQNLYPAATDLNQNSLQISNNPVSGNEIFVKGKTESIRKAEIYNLQGKLIQTIDQPFKNTRNSIRIKNPGQGIYLLKLDDVTLKFIVK
ncbi:endonuclease I [Chryseobacterium sp. SORGH_AS 447]|uniref:endonuclease n=1 Tax=Chryseobacterium sp. SORGH_AS_0447 TaxID=3041769 RepID=UPI002786D46E|nr:endonuclease [Chryseobacterium sp. SORGH_AS_0447]MDQ1161147.1 endonuclease I [Chryseobacterium sp. SORGH_AS_0447]